MADIILRCLAVGDSVVPALGMQAIPDQLAAGLLPGTVHLGCAAASVAPGEVRLVDGRVVRGARVVVATEGPVAAKLLSERQVASPGSRTVSCVWFAAPKAPVDDKLDHPRRHDHRPGAERGGDEQRVTELRARGSSPDRRGVPGSRR